MRSGAGHMPLPICARPRRPQSKPANTLRRSYAPNHLAIFILPLRTMAPPYIPVCISSPVRSKNPVLIKATRAPAAAIAALILTLMRRSSSMIPNLTVFSGRPSNFSTRAKSSLANATSSALCIFGLTM